MILCLQKTYLAARDEPRSRAIDDIRGRMDIRERMGHGGHIRGRMIPKLDFPVVSQQEQE